jgi:hypothetical protein
MISGVFMAQRKLKVFNEYHYGKRGVLRPGDRFRVRGGPVYINSEGKRISLAERGLHVFRQYCVRGAEKWIEASAVGGCSHVLIWVGKASRSPVVPNLIRRPYRLRKVLEAVS